jgi:hypothetical protein
VLLVLPAVPPEVFAPAPAAPVSSVETDGPSSQPNEKSDEDAKKTSKSEGFDKQKERIRRC